MKNQIKGTLTEKTGLLHLKEFEFYDLKDQAQLSSCAKGGVLLRSFTKGSELHKRRPYDLGARANSDVGVGRRVHGLPPLRLLAPDEYTMGQVVSGMAMTARMRTLEAID